jgi:hypothetical protein
MHPAFNIMCFRMSQETIIIYIQFIRGIEFLSYIICSGWVLIDKQMKIFLRNLNKQY